jgi:hypothetical protein
MAAPDPSRIPRARNARLRGVTAGALVVVASLLLPVSLVGVWLREEVLDTDAFVATAGDVARDAAVQRDVSDRVSTALIRQLDVDRRVQDAAGSVLPDVARSLSGPLAAGADATIRRTTAAVVASSRFEDLWEVAVRRAHENALRLARGEPVAGVETRNGRIAVNLDPIVDAVVAQLPGPVAALIPPVTTGDDIVFFRSSELADVQPIVAALDDAWWSAPVLALILFAVAVGVATRRRLALLGVAAGILLSTLVTFLVLVVARERLVDAAAGRVARTATAAVFDAVVALLRTELWVAAAIGVALAAGTVVFGLLQRPHPVAASGVRPLTEAPVLPGAEPTAASREPVPEPDRTRVTPSDLRDPSRATSGAPGGARDVPGRTSPRSGS